MKRCAKCKLEKDESEFNKCKSKKDGLYYACKDCTGLYRKANNDRLKVYFKEYNEANKETISAKRRKHYLANRDKIRAKNKEYQAANKEKRIATAKASYPMRRPNIFARAILDKHGLTVEDYAWMLHRSDFKCPLCGVVFWSAGSNSQAAIDHDHHMEKNGLYIVRGIICSSCNMLLGRIGDDPNVLRKLADYIERHHIRNSLI